MRVRITRQLSGSIDGIRLDNFQVGRVYDVGTLMGCYLLAELAAEPLADDPAVAVASPAFISFEIFPAKQQPPEPPSPLRAPEWSRATAADRPRRRRKPRT